jgi:hypothetical protein
MWYVGQKITLKKEFYGYTWSAPHPVLGQVKAVNPPKDGEIYTIGSFDDRFNELCAFFSELVAQYEVPIQPSGWNLNAFEPVCKKSTETGMEILRKLLNTNKELV